MKKLMMLLAGFLLCQTQIFAAGSKYIPGHIIVKYKNQAGKTFDYSNLSPSAAQMNTRRKVKRADRLFRNLDGYLKEGRMGNRILRKSMEELGVATSVSIGALTVQQATVTANDVLSAGDELMFRAKKEGKDRIVHETLGPPAARVANLRSV